jgi:serine/threonine protein kinase
MMDRLIGQNLNQYRIIRLVSENQVGTIFRAQDVNLQREIALMVLHPSLASRPNFEDHFVEATRSAARIDHPSVSHVFDFGRAKEYYYIVMEYIQGRNLEQMLNDLRNGGRWILLGEAVQFVRQLAAAVDYLRNQSDFQPIVDPALIGIKPGQVDDLPYRPVLTDPGIVRFLEQRLFPQGEARQGPLTYLSPEHAVKRGSDARSDVYSLGILLFELSTGQQPFPIQTLDDAVRYHTRQPTPSPRSFRPDLPESLEKIILRSTEKNPANRYPDAASLARDLQVVLPAASSIQTPPPAFEGASSLLTPYLQSLDEPSRPAVLEEYGATVVKPNTVPEDDTALQIIVEDNQLSVEPGGRISTRIFVLNRRLPAGYFRFSIDGLPESWSAISPQVIQLNPGEQNEVSLTIEPPRVPQSRAGRYPLTFRVSSEPGPAQVAESPITLSVAAFSRFSSQVDPKVLATGEIARVSIENQGNVPDTFRIHFTDRESSLVFTPPEAQMRLVEGQSGTAEFKTGLQQARWIGGERRHMFSTNVSAAAGETQSHSGEFVSLPIIPFWVLGVLLFSCLCSVALLAFFFSREGLEETRATSTFLAEQTATVLAIESTSEALTATALFLATLETIEPLTPMPSETPTDFPTPTPTETPDLDATALAATQTEAALQESARLTETALAAIEATASALAATQTAQSAIQTSIALTATAQAPTTQPPPPEETRLVYFHLADTSTANAFRSLLQDNEFVVDLMPLDAATTVNYEPYDVIILGPDTGNQGAWGDPQGNQANTLNQTLLPILGLEEGGASFFGLFGMPIGWQNSITGEGTNIAVVDPGYPAWTTPHAISIPEDRIVALYTANSDFVAISGQAPPADLTLIGRHPQDPAYYLVARYQNRFILWGYENDPEDMTPAGQQLFVNIVELLVP